MKRSDSDKIRFNIIDFLIIVIAIGCIAGVIMRYDIIDKIVVDRERDEVSVSFMITGISPQISDQIKDGDEFYVVGANTRLGVLEDHTVSNAEKVEANENGFPVRSYDDTSRDVRGTFTSYGVNNEDGFFLGGTLFIAPGKTLTIESRNVRISVIITEISRGTGE
ncbi:MAG: DUF4330 family protein [Clostridia bacterium]|nr:DUF4330 family protein [Clostridia bacterium]